MFKRVLIPIDGSPVASKAAKAGVAFAKALGAKVVSCYVVEELRPAYRARGMVTQELIDEVNQSNLDRAQQLVEKLGKVATKAGVPFTPVVSTGHRPHERILAVAKQHKCDVIFMATHGRSGFSKLVMGSVTQKVLAHATLPILIYR